MTYNVLPNFCYNSAFKFYAILHPRKDDENTESIG